jgi:hypothetical protein
VKTSTTIALAVVASLSGSLVAYAQTESPTPYHHHIQHVQPRHHTVYPAPATAPAAAAATPAPQAAPFGLSLPHIAPYPNNKGDEDGLSEDANDCNKGCIDGNPE